MKSGKPLIRCNFIAVGGRELSDQDEQGAGAEKDGLVEGMDILGGREGGRERELEGAVRTDGVMDFNAGLWKGLAGLRVG